jgi:hypothetical protein
MPLNYLIIFLTLKNACPKREMNLTFWKLWNDIAAENSRKIVKV